MPVIPTMCEVIGGRKPKTLPEKQSKKWAWSLAHMIEYPLV
jgi:hypothetical protein